MEQSPIDLITDDAMDWPLLGVNLSGYVDYPSDNVELDDLGKTV